MTSHLGIGLMILTMLIFAAQDGLSRYLASEYNVFMVVMIRYWFFAVFAISLAARSAKGLAATLATKQPVLQIIRGVLLALEVCVMVAAFTVLGLVESLAIFAAYPLIVAALSGPILGEHVGPRRWIAIGLGLVGVLIILRPGAGVFSPYSIIPVASATMFAVYTLLTRYAARLDTTQTSFTWTGIAGAVTMTMIGLWYWQPMAPGDWAVMGVLCVTGAAGHWTLIKCYELAEASALQPFAYLHIVFGTAIGVLFFAEPLAQAVILGAGIVIAAGLFTLARERRAG